MKAPQREPLKIHRKRGFHEQRTESKSYEVGMQISSHMDTEMPEKRAIWGSEEVFRRSVTGASAEKGV